MDHSDSDSDDEEEIHRDYGDIEITSSPGKDDLLQMLECPVCLNLPINGIRTCYQGHILCLACAGKIKLCPLCRKKIGIGRNFFAEDFLNRCQMKCPFSPEGCIAIVKGETYKQHLMECNFRPIKCGRCMAKIHFNDFEKHLIEKHSISQWEIDDYGNRVIVAEKCKTKRFRIELNDVFSPALLYKSLFAAFALSLLVDEFWIFSCILDYVI